ncbi:Retrovirus-related Pol polyprotein from transposon RE1 [Bienertia sinuspersici]
MADITKIHPATTLTNIKACIPITLDYAGTQYNNWCTLFKLHCRAYLVLSHILPSFDNTTAISDSSSKAEEEKFAALIPWQRLDDIVRQWIYSTISNDLLNTILSPDDNAMDTWNHLVRLFQGNKSARALQYDTQFYNVKLEQFPGVKEYCTRIKTLADNLRNVGSHVSDEQMVLRLLRGLSDDYKPFKTSIQHLVPLPNFETVLTMLELEETNTADDDTAAVSDAALVSDVNGIGPPPPTQSIATSHNSQPKGNTNHRNNNRGKIIVTTGTSTTAIIMAITATTVVAAAAVQVVARMVAVGPSKTLIPTIISSHSLRFHRRQCRILIGIFHLGPRCSSSLGPLITPCPYPTSGFHFRPNARSPTPSSTPGILGSRPSQSFYTAAPSPSHDYAPTNIDQAMHTLSLQQPDENWYMDTGATSHMTSSEGDLSSYFLLSNNNSIVVGNGSMIPIRGYGHASLSNTYPILTLKNVLYAPHLIKNLISVRKFTTDNMVSIEFEPFGFSVKDLRTGNDLMRYESSGDLYPFTNDFRAISSSTPSTYAAISSSIWHSRLGHPGGAILSSLHNNNLIVYNKARHNFCHSCPLGKMVKLPFNNSLSSTTMPFDIIHSDLWTSPVVSYLGHKYYVLFLDNYTNFLWTFPLSRKSQVYKIFLSFRTYIRTQFEKDIKTFQCDNGREFNNDPFLKFCNEYGMSFRFSCPHTSPKMAKPNEKLNP